MSTGPSKQTEPLRNLKPKCIFLKFFPWVTGHGSAAVTRACSKTQLAGHSRSAPHAHHCCSCIRYCKLAFYHCTQMLPLDRVRPTPYDKGFAHPHFLKSFSLLNQIPLHLPSAWCKAKLVLEKMVVSERGLSPSGRGQEISRRLPRRNVTQCSHPSPQRTRKVTDFPDHIQEGIESNLFAAPADSRREE